MIVSFFFVLSEEDELLCFFGELLLYFVCVEGEVVICNFLSSIFVILLG